ncbi:MAG: TraB/GumN family protein [Rhizomicrobium sp.]
MKPCSFGAMIAPLRKVFSAIGFIALLLAPLSAAPVLAANAAHANSLHAKPALWRVQGKGGSVTLFGSVHVLPAGIDWQTPELMAAFKAADVVVFEIPVDSALQTALVKARDTQGTLPAGKTLASQLSPTARANFAKVVGQLNWSEAALADKRPWLVSLLLDTAVMRQSGMTEAGPDFVLMQRAKDAGKTVRYLETVDQQMALLVPADPVTERQMLEDSLQDFPHAVAELKGLVAAWAKGDARGVDAAVGQDMADYPALRGQFLTDRNRNWVRQIGAMAGEKKNVLVVVGVGHLVGPDSVPALLRAEGFKVTGP